MLDRTRPMNLGDIFNTAIQLIKETFLRNLVIAAVFFVPAGVVISFGFDYFFSLLMKYNETSLPNGAEAASHPEFGNIFLGIFIYTLAITLLIFCTLVVSIGVTFISKTQLNGKRISVKESFQKIFSITIFRTIGQSILLGLIISFIIGIPVLLMIIATAAEINSLTVPGVLLLVASIFIVLFLIISWYFAFTAIVCDDTTVFESFSKSFYLVKNYWWRTFGLIILISITVQFAISIITTPVSFIVMWGFLSEYFKLIAGGEYNQNDPSQTFSMFSSFGFGLGIIITFSSILQYVITPIFNVILYYDLKIRKNDFEDDEIVTPDEIQPGV
jgi:hypothetical protein